MAITYEFRSDVLAKEILYSIDGNQLTSSVDGVIIHKMDLSKIVQVRMKYAPTRYVKNKFVMEVKDLSGQNISISNAHYVSLGNFENRSNDYKEFVLQFHKNLGEVNKICKCVGGVVQSSYTVNIFSLIFVVIILIMALLIMIATGLYFIVIMHLIFIIYYLPASLRFIKVNKPKIYFPNSIPNNLLPNN